MRLLAKALIIFFFISCGTDQNVSNLSSTEPSEDIVLEESCVTEVTEKLIDNAIFTAEKIGNACEKQNKAMAKNGYDRCPTKSCMSTHKIGGKTAPTMEIKVTNSSGSSSFGYSSMSSYSMGGRGTGDTVYVTLTLNMSLGKNPDEITCVNPLSPVSIDKIMEEIINLNKKTKSCSAK